MGLTNNLLCGIVWEMGDVLRFFIKEKNKMDKFTTKQISEMLHAKGYRIEKKVDRNYFNTGIKCSGWENLVENGYATRKEVHEELGGVYYYLTKKGETLLQTLQ